MCIRDRITAEKKTTGRKRQEDDIEGKQEKERNVKRILGIYHKGTLQKEDFASLAGLTRKNGGPDYKYDNRCV